MNDEKKELPGRSFSVFLDSKTVNAVENYRADKRPIPTFTEAIRELVRKALST